MRWSAQAPTGGDAGALPGLEGLHGVIRSVRPPEFAGVTFHEVHCRSALNKVPPASQLPFAWTVNPYRGCSHACVYCFARQTHTYLDFDAGADFDREIVVKLDVAGVLRKELQRPGWSREQVAMGTSTDPYQRAEGRYRLMPGIITALADSGTPLSILTKGTVLARDLPLLRSAGRSVPVGVGVSLALLDPELQARLEPGTPSPAARLTLIRRIRDAGLPCGVMLAPLLPYLTDGEEQLQTLMEAVRDAGATGVTGIVLHLRPGAREWFLKWLAERHPELTERYRRLYHGGTYASATYRTLIAERIRAVRARVGLAGTGTAVVRGVPGDGAAAFPVGALPPPAAVPGAGSTSDVRGHRVDPRGQRTGDALEPMTLFPDGPDTARAWSGRGRAR